jgi:hypothetical protein
VVDLDDATKQRAEALALEACRELAAAAADFDPPQPTRVEWRTGERDPHEVVWRESGGYADGVELWQNGTCEWSDEYGAMEDIDVPSAEALWALGLALYEITPDAVRIVVPPVGGGRG